MDGGWLGSSQLLNSSNIVGHMCLPYVVGHVCRRIDLISQFDTLLPCERLTLSSETFDLKAYEVCAVMSRRR